jgi:hypothetical protein
VAAASAAAAAAAAAAVAAAGVNHVAYTVLLAAEADHSSHAFNECFTEAVAHSRVCCFVQMRLVAAVLLTFEPMIVADEYQCYRGVCRLCCSCR